jgi:hypothetical protein
VVSKSPYLVKIWRNGVWLWPKDSYIKCISWRTFEGTLNDALESLTKEFIII